MNSWKIPPLAAALVVASVFGCSSSRGGATAGGGDPGGAPSLVAASIAVAPGDPCANGGIRVDVGIDDNRNGQLDPAEIDTSEYVCNGAPGATSLVRTSAEPGGVHCAAGGVRIDSGVDLNGNGALDPAEVTSTAYVCNGAGAVPGGVLDTAITAGPARTTTSREATFWFGGTSAASFRCRLDGAASAACASPTTYTGLADGVHAFEVTAYDGAGQPDLTPALYAWTVDTTPPAVAITGAPPAFGSDPSPQVAFTVTEPGARTLCALDQAIPVACASPWAVGPLADGAHELAITAVDAAGNVDPSPARVAFTVDTVPPSTIVDLAPGSPSPASVTVAFHASEPATFRCALDGTAPVACASPFVPGALADGAHALTVAAVDLAGNVDPSPAVLAFTVDGRAPDTTISAGPAAVATVRAATFSFASTLAGATFRCALDGGVATACTSPLVLTDLADGPHALGVVATSLAGVVDATPATWAWTVDATPPETAFTEVPPEVSASTTASFAFVASEQGAVTRCALDGAGPQPCTSPLVLTGIATGMHELRVTAVDAAGNEDPTPATWFWFVEVPGALDTFITGGPADPTREAAVAVYFTGEGATGFECILDGANPAPCTSPFQAAGLVEGPHVFSVAAVSAGSVDATPATLSWTVDVTPPLATIVSGPQGGSTVATSVSTFGFASNEPGGTFECALDGAAPVPCGATWTTAALADGIHGIEVRALDRAGNLSVAPDRREWTIDTVAPDAVFVASVVDPEAGLAWAQVALSEPGTVEWTFDAVAASSLCTSAAGVGTVHDVVCSGLSEGAHVLAVTAVDVAGNRAVTPAILSFEVGPTLNGGTSTAFGGATALVRAQLAKARSCTKLGDRLVAQEQAWAVDEWATNISSAVEAGRLSYDQARADACIAATYGASCEQLDFAQPTACFGWVAGLVQEGGSCFSDRECAAGWCNTNACPGTCTAFVAAGSQCSAREACGPGNVCSYIPASATNTCAAATLGSAAGQPCGNWGPGCAAGLFCDGSRTCRERLPAGATCTQWYECQAGLGCDASYPNTGICRPLAGPGESCAGAICGDGLYCGASGSICVEFPIAGEDCTDPALQGDLRCWVDGSYCLGTSQKTCTLGTAAVGAACEPYPTATTPASSLCVPGSWCTLNGLSYACATGSYAPSACYYDYSYSSAPPAAAP